MAALISTYTALLEVYLKLDGDNWTNNTNWLVYPDYCLWHGITCDATFNVVSIDLSDNNLTGILPEIIQNLPNLKALYLRNNNIFAIDLEAMLDKPFCTVDLSHNKLVTLPPCFKADIMDLSYNQITSFPTGSAMNLNLKCNKIIGNLPLITPPTYDFTCNAGIICPPGNIFCSNLNCLDCLI